MSAERLRTFAAFCRFYPGFTLDDVRAMRLGDFNAFVEFMREYQEAEAAAYSGKATPSKTNPVSGDANRGTIEMKGEPRRMLGRTRPED